MLKESYANYYFLTEGVSNFGGAQLLVLRRAKFLQKIGLNVKIIVLRHRGEFILENQFNNIPILYLQELENPFLFYSKKHKQNLLQTVHLFLKDTENSIFESHSLQAAVWCEFFASVLKIKHIVYLLNEAKANKYRYYPSKGFFYFKYNRGELFGASDQSLERIFQKSISGFRNQYINVSFDPNELLEKTEPTIEKLELIRNSKTILTVSRLEKKYVEDLIKACLKFAKSYPEQNINLIIAGGTIHKDIEDKLKNDFLPPKTYLPNLKIHFIGYISTLGKDIFKLAEVFVGMGTASINSISQGCVTLNIDPKMNMTSGIFGVDTNNFAYSSNDKVYKIEDKIFAVLNDSKLHNEAKLQGKKLFETKFTNKASFDKLEFLLQKSDSNLTYFYFKNNLFIRIFDLFIIYIRHLKNKIL